MPRNNKVRGGPSVQAPSGRQLRKERRKEERVTSKKRAAPLVPNFEGHDSDSRSSKRRLELFVLALRKSIEKEEQRLMQWTPPKTPEQLEAERKKKRGSGLKGAARPAWEVYPELYPEMHKEEAPEPTVDLLAEYSPECFSNPETRQLVGHYFQLGHALLTEDGLRGKGKQAQDAFKKSLELDKSDPFDSRLGYFIASLERGEILEESEEILKIEAEVEDSLRNAELLYHRALVEFMNASEGEDANKEENDKHSAFEDALMAAVEACPDIAIALVNHEMVSAVVDTAKVLHWIRDEREYRCAKAMDLGVPDRMAGRCDASACYSSRGMAIAFFVNFAQYWVDGGIVEVMRSMLEDVEIVDKDEDDGQDDEEEEEPEEASYNQPTTSRLDPDHDVRWMDKSLRRYFDEAALKFQNTLPEEGEDSEDE